MIRKFYKRFLLYQAMVLKVIDATQAKPGATILIEGEAYTVRSNDISKTGKHGASKCRIEAIGIFNKKKKVLAVNGGERFDVPLVEKHRGQILSVSQNTVSVMDLETYETLDIAFMEELEGKLEPEQQIEYWDVEGKKMVMRIL